MQSITFHKFHGNGNDFIFVDKEILLNFHSVQDLRKFAVKICHRNFFIGADGIVFFNEDENSLLIMNSDGSIAATCGNALRCYGLKLLQEKKWAGNLFVSVKRLIPSFLKNILLEKNELFAAQEEIFATLIEGSLDTNSVTVAMGYEVQCRVVDLPENGFNLSSRVDSAKSRSDKTLTPMLAVFVILANPHVVFVSPTFADFNSEQHKQFGLWAQSGLLSILKEEIPVSNVSMITLPTTVQQQSFDLVVYERGAGLTLCCGSGAVASRIALEKLGFVQSIQNKISFNLPGGVVDITSCSIMGEKQRALAGSAQFVFKGIVEWT